MTSKNETLREKAKACNSNIQYLINKLTDIQKDISEYVNKSNAIDALEELNMPINPMIAFQLIQIQVKLLCDSVSMGEHLDKVANSLRTVTNAFNEDMFGDDADNFISENDVEAIMKMMEDEEGENNE